MSYNEQGNNVKFDSPNQPSTGYDTPPQPQQPQTGYPQQPQTGYPPQQPQNLSYSPSYNPNYPLSGQYPYQSQPQPPKGNSDILKGVFIGGSALLIVVLLVILIVSLLGRPGGGPGGGPGLPGSPPVNGQPQPPAGIAY